MHWYPRLPEDPDTFVDKAGKTVQKFKRILMSQLRELDRAYTRWFDGVFWRFFESEFAQAERKRIAKVQEVDPHYENYPRLNVHDWLESKGKIFPEEEQWVHYSTGNDSAFFADAEFEKFAKIMRPITKKRLEWYYDKFMQWLVLYIQGNVQGLATDYNTTFLPTVVDDEQVKDFLQIGPEGEREVRFARPDSIEQRLFSVYNHSSTPDVCVIKGPFIGDTFHRMDLYDRKYRWFVLYAMEQYIKDTYGPQALDQLRMTKTGPMPVHNPLIETKHIHAADDAVYILDVSNIRRLIDVLYPKEVHDRLTLK